MYTWVIPENGDKPRVSDFPVGHIIVSILKKCKCIEKSTDNNTLKFCVFSQRTHVRSCKLDIVKGNYKTRSLIISFDDKVHIRPGSILPQSFQ